MLEVRVLGPFAVERDGKPINLGGRQRRTLLAVLVVYVGEVVSTAKLIDELWGEAPPSSARKTVQAHVSHLRRALNSESELLASESDGYILRLEPDSVDSHRFETLLERARDVRHAKPDDAIEDLERALDLFTGAPFADVADNAFSIRVEASRLEALHQAAVEDRLETLLQMGDSDSVAAEAERLLAGTPLRERLWGILMLALYRSGRQAEALQAFSRARQVLAEELGIEPSTALQDLEQRILEQDSDLTVGSITRADRSEKPVVRNPYKGLRFFDESDSPDFFGRDALVRRLQERVSSSHNSLVLLVGPSGAGKSSVVRAGLIPALRDADRRVVVTFPGSSPIENLANVVARELGLSLEETRSRILDSEGMEGDLVVVVDQLEEVFTAGADDDSVDRFLDLLANPPPGIQWVATVRADFIGRLLSDFHLGGLVSDSTILVPPLREHEVKAAVEGPARRVGLNVEPELTTALVRDVAEQPASLPLLQYALADLFDRSNRQSVGLVDYEAAGGISGPLVRRAEEMFESFNDADQLLTRALFLELVTVTEEGNEVRRRLRRSGLVEQLGRPVDRIVDRFGEIRLLTFDHDPDTGDATVEIAHEALIDAWPRLDRWVSEAAEDLRIRRRLMQATQEWESADRNPDYLLSGSRLLAFTSWEGATDLRLAGATREFLDQSVEHERAEQSRRSRIRRTVVGSLSAIALVAIGLAIVAFSQGQAAEREADRANQEADRANDQAELAEDQKRNAELAARRAEVRRLAARSSATLASDPAAALIDAIEAVEISRRDGELPVLKEAEEALRQAVQSIRTVLDLDASRVAQFSPDGSEIIAAVSDGASIWTTAPADFIGALAESAGSITAATFVESEDLVVTNSADGTTEVWDANSGEKIRTLDVGQIPFGLTYSPAANLLAISYPEDAPDAFSLGQVRLFDTRTWELVWARTAPDSHAVAFNEDGSLVAAFTSQGVTVWSTSSGEIMTSIPFEAGLDLRGDVAFAGERIVYARDDTVRIYEPPTGNEIGNLLGPSEVTRLDVFGDTLVAAGMLSGEVVIWEVDTGREVATLSGLNSEILDVDFHPSGEIVAAATRDSVRAWDFSPDGSYEWYTIDEHPRVLETHASSDGSVLASVGLGEDHDVWIWDATTGALIRKLTGHAGTIFRARFGPGSLLGTASGEGSARIWDAGSGDQTQDFPVPSNVWGVSFSSDGSRFAYAHGPAFDCEPGPGFVEVRDLIEDDILFSQAVSTESGVFDARLSPEAEWIVTSSCGTLAVWNISDGTLAWEVDVGEEPDTPTVSIAVSPDGSQIATGGFDGVVRVWDLSDGQLRRTLEGHFARVTSVEFTSDGSLLVSGSEDGTARIWNVQGGYEEVAIGGHESAIEHATFTPDGTRLITTWRDGIIRIHALDVDDLLGLAMEKLERFANIIHLG